LRSTSLETLQALDTGDAGAPLAVDAIRVSIEVQTGINESRRVGDIGIRCLTSVAPVPVQLIGAAPLDVQTSEERDGMLRFAVLVIHSGRRHVAVAATGEGRTLGTQRTRLVGGSSWMDEAATLSIGTASGHPECLDDIGRYYHCCTWIKGRAYATDLRLVFGVARNIPHVGSAVSKLAFDTISAALLLFPVAADFRLVPGKSTNRDQGVI
jgi:hypothetical protein